MSETADLYLHSLIVNGLVHHLHNLLLAHTRKLCPLEGIKRHSQNCHKVIPLPHCIDIAVPEPNGVNYNLDSLVNLTLQNCFSYIEILN